MENDKQSFNPKIVKIKGDLIKFAKEGRFDVIAHGCNCFCKQKSGIASQMVEHFNTDKFEMEDEKYKGDYNKLGNIDYKTCLLYRDTPLSGAYKITFGNASKQAKDVKMLHIVNAYTQFKPGEATSPYNIPLDYDGLRMCFRKMNREFCGFHIGIPMIGSGLAKGDWTKIEKIIHEEFTNCNVTIVEYHENQQEDPKKKAEAQGEKKMTDGKEQKVVELKEKGETSNKKKTGVSSWVLD